MAKHQVLARKYRPKAFKDLRGQNDLVTSLSNAIKNNRLHQAYMLNGTRGIGKTTTARIIARTLNCQEKTVENRPCGTCPNCLEMERRSHIDVIEIDAASNTGVDDVRNVIIDTVEYPPSLGKYKIYIIDEVHMFSKNAFNALLKTLEEPPAHVIFILATTEINKVPITILSRCQRFFLKIATRQQLFEHINFIVQNEGLEIEEKAARLIADKAEGSFRDCLSILDQAMVNSIERKNITFEITKDILNISDQTDLLKLLDFIKQGVTDKALTKLEDIYYRGNDHVSLMTSFMELLKDLMQAKVSQITTHENDLFLKHSKTTSMPHLISFWEIALKTLEELTLPGHPRTKLDIFIIKLIHCSSLPSVDELQERLKGGDIAQLLNEFKGAGLV